MIQESKLYLPASTLTRARKFFIIMSTSLITENNFICILEEFFKK